MTKTEHFSNLKKYNQKGQRLALFGRMISTEGGHQSLEIFKLTCSKKDAFYKKMAHSVYEVYLLKGIEALNATGFHPEVYTLPIKDPARPKWSFLVHCNEEYYHLKYWNFPFMGEGMKDGIMNYYGKYNQRVTIKSLVK